MQASASQIEQLLDKLSVTFNEEVQASLEIIYKQAMALEIEFFSAQSLSTEAVQVPYFKSASAAKERLVFVSDFDSTCTVADSSSILADLTVKIAALSNTTNATSLQQQWDELVKEYLEEYEEVLGEALNPIGGFNVPNFTFHVRSPFPMSQNHPFKFLTTFLFYFDFILNV